MSKKGDMKMSRLLKTLNFIHRRRNTPDLSSFIARCKNGITVQVSAVEKGVEMYFYDGIDYYEHRSGTIVEAHKILQEFGIDIDSIEI